MRVAVFNDTRGDRGHYGCAIVMDRLAELIGELGGEIVSSWPFDRDWRRSVSDLPKPGDVDAIIVNGEGTMHGAPKRSRAVALAQLGRLARSRYKVPIALINATLYDNDRDFYEELRLFDQIFLRDRMSVALCKQYGLTVEYCPDLTLISGKAASASPAYHGTRRAGIGVTDSVERLADIALRRLARATGAEFAPMVETRISLPAGLRKLRPSVIRNWRRAGRVRREFGEDLRFATAYDFVDWIRSKELIVTGRYHTVTLCLLTRTPFLFLESNTPKSSALCMDTGIRRDRQISQADKIGKIIAENNTHFSQEEEISLEKFFRETQKKYQNLQMKLGSLFSER